MWHYPAKKASGLLMFMGCIMIAFSLESVLIDGLSPSYILAAGPMLIGAGCAMLVYHAQKRGEEDIAAKKKIVLVGIAMSTLVSALEILNLLNIL